MMEQSRSTTSSPPLPFSERTMRYLSRRLGFKERSNLKYFLFTASPLFLFILLHAKFVLVSRFFCHPIHGGAAPGECYWYTQPFSRWQIGIHLHLWSVIPGSLLAITQFVPTIRASRPRLHRYLGYACWACGLTAIVSALMIGDRAFGGTPLSQVAIGCLAAWALLGHLKAYDAIRAHRIDEHRAWMLRTWGVIGCVVSMRPFMGVYASTIWLLNKLGAPGADFWNAIQLPCEVVFYMLNTGKDVGNATRRPDFWSTYGAECAPGLVSLTSPATVLNGTIASPSGGMQAVVSGAKATLVADFTSKRVDRVTPALALGFGPAIAICMIVHLLVVEWYLRKTAEEGTRLKKVGEARRRAKEREAERKKTAVQVEERIKEEKSKGRRQQEGVVAQTARVEAKEMGWKAEDASVTALNGKESREGKLS